MTTIHDANGGWGVYADGTDYCLEVVRRGAVFYLPAELVVVGDLVTPTAFFQSQQEADLYIAELIPVIRVERE